MILRGILTYYVWRTMFIAKYKSEKLWKYINSLTILLGPDFKQKTFRVIITLMSTICNLITKTIKIDSNLDKLIKFFFFLRYS